MRYLAKVGMLCRDVANIGDPNMIKASGPMHCKVCAIAAALVVTVEDGVGFHSNSSALFHLTSLITASYRFRIPL